MNVIIKCKFKERFRINHAESGTYVVCIYEKTKQRFTTKNQEVLHNKGNNMNREEELSH